MSHPNDSAQSASRERQALFAGLSAVLLWSTVATGFKLGLAQLTALQLVLLGSTVSTLIFAVAFMLSPVRNTVRGIGPLLKEAAPLALINPLLYYPAVLAGYDRLPAQIAQPLNYTWAVVLALLAVPLLKQPLSRRLLWGIAISYAGAVLVVVGGQQLLEASTSGADQMARVAPLPVGVVNTTGAVPVQASYGTSAVPTLQPADRTAYRELARQRLRRYSQEHAEHASLNTPAGMLPFARVPVIEGQEVTDEQ